MKLPCREALACLSRPDGKGGELHFLTIVILLRPREEVKERSKVIGFLILRDYFSLFPICDLKSTI